MAETYSTTGSPAPYRTVGSSQPYSFQTSGVNVLFGDGRVKLLNEEFNITTAAALASRNGATKEVTVSQDF